jgi:hypothetical protein
MEVLQSFSSQFFTGGITARQLVLVFSVRLGENKESHLGAA